MDNPNFFSFVHTVIRLLLTELSKDPHQSVVPSYYALLEKNLVDLDDFAKSSKAEEVCFPDSLQTHLGLSYKSIAILSSISYGTKNICQIGEDKIYKFPDGGFICRITYLSCEYGEFNKTVCNIVFAPTKEKALNLVNTYYKDKKNNNFNRHSVLDKFGQKIFNFRAMGWEDIYLPNNMISEIRNEIDTFFKCEEIYKARNIVWKRGLLLAGSPGNGKTSICRAVATNSNVPVVYCSLGNNRDLHSVLANMQDTISANAPCIAIYEDADLFGKDETTRAATLNMMDGLFTVDGVLTLATTNNPKKLDTAFTSRPSRFDSYYVIGNPTLVEIKLLLQAKLGKDFTKISESDKRKLLSGLKGFSASFVQEVAVYAIMQSIKTKKPIDSKLLFGSLNKAKRHVKSSQDGESAWSVPLGFGDIEGD